MTQHCISGKFYLQGSTEQSLKDNSAARLKSIFKYKNIMGKMALSWHRSEIRHVLMGTLTENLICFKQAETWTNFYCLKTEF